MARPKGAKNKKKTNHVFQDPKVEEIVEEWVEFKDPKTGKMIRQLVKVKKLKKVIGNPHKVFVGASDFIEDLESQDSSLSDLGSESED